MRRREEANARKRPRCMRADPVPDVVRLPANAHSADDIFIRRRHPAPSRNQKKAAPLAHWSTTNDAKHERRGREKRANEGTKSNNLWFRIARNANLIRRCHPPVQNRKSASQQKTVQLTAANRRKKPVTAPEDA